MDNLHIEDMNWQDIKQAVENGYTSIIIGVGSTEQHGPHLPLKTDSSITEEIVKKAAGIIGKILIAPVIRTGCSEHHLAFSGSISLRDSTLKAVMADFVSSFIRHGFKTIIFLSAHGGNFGPMRKAINELQKQYPEHKIIGYTDMFGFIEPVYVTGEKNGITRKESGAHAGESEASIILHLYPELVKKERFAPGYTGEVGSDQLEIILSKGMPALTENGILGDPRKADAGRGREYIEALANFLAEKIKEQMEQRMNIK